MYVRCCLPAQPVDATQALNFSAGVSNPRVLRGRSLSWRATLLRWAYEYTDKSAPFGKYCLSRPLVFSLEPRCHGLLWIAKIYVDVGRQRKAAMIRKFLAPVPGQGLIQLLRLLDERGDYRSGVLTCHLGQ